MPHSPTSAAAASTTSSLTCIPTVARRSKTGGTAGIAPSRFPRSTTPIVPNTGIPRGRLHSAALLGRRGLHVELGKHRRPDSAEVPGRYCRGDVARLYSPRPGGSRQSLRGRVGAALGFHLRNDRVRDPHHPAPLPEGAPVGLPGQQDDGRRVDDGLINHRRARAGARLLRAGQPRSDERPARR